MTTTTMPPEMSTATAPPTAVAMQRDSLSRSRFMITDILAGSAAAAAAAMHNGTRISPISNGHNNNNNNNGINGHNHRSSSPSFQQQQQQHAAALQHYIAQQQHLLQQQQQQHHQQHQHQHHHNQQQQQQHQQQQHHLSQQVHQFRGGSPTRASPPSSAAILQSTAATVPSVPHHLTSPHHTQFSGHHPLAHLPPNALLGFSTSGAAQAAAHYAALQHERSRLRDLEASAVGVSAGAGGIGGRGSNTSYDHDDRSRSPLPSNGGMNERSSVQLTSNSVGGGGGGGGGGCGGSISGDQASTIDDSDSDTCGAKDDDCNSSIKSDNLMGLTKKQRKARTAFTDHQLQTLEKSFERQKYLSVQDRMELANKLELSDCQVKTWYQNRRTKWKRQTAVGLELLAEAGNYAAFQRLYGGSPYLGAWPYSAAAAAAAQSPHGAPASAIDIYYRQAAAAVALQKPLTYRMYHPGAPGGLPSMGGGMPPMHPTTLTHLGATSSLSSLGSYYQAGMPSSMLNSANGLPPPPSQPTTTTARPLNDSPAQRSDADSEKRPTSADLSTARTTPSPQLNPGSPEPERVEHNSSCRSTSVDDADDEDDAIEV